MSKKIQKNVNRYDIGELKSATRTPQGFLECYGFATRTGVFPYVKSDGSIRRELRHPDEVFAPKSLASLKNVPVTIEHPPEMLNPQNVAMYRKGHVTEHVQANRDLVEIKMIVEDADAIMAVEQDNMRELSSGYGVDIVWEAGEYEGAPYDCIQTNIIYNHQAIVSRGRAGPEIRLRLDSADALMQDEGVRETEFQAETSTDSVDPNPETKTVVVMGEEVNLPAHLADCIHDMFGRDDEYRNKLAKLEADMAARKDNGAVNLAVSPSVDVVQAVGDGRNASGKVAPSSSGKRDAEEEAKAKKDAEEAKEKKDAEEAKAKADAEAEMDADELAAKKDAELDQAKKDVDDLKKKLDAAEAKVDEAQSATLNRKEKPPEGAGKMDSAENRKIIRARVKLEKQAESILPPEQCEKFDSMSDDDIRTACIVHSRPGVDMKGKSSVYLESRFDSIVESLEDERGTEFRKDAGRAAMGGEGGGARTDGADAKESDPEAARAKMIASSREEYKKPVGRQKKNA